MNFFAIDPYFLTPGAAVMAKRDSFLLRVDPAILEAVRKWSDDEMRSINGQIEFLLRQSLLQSGRLPNRDSTTSKKSSDENPKK